MKTISLLSVIGVLLLSPTPALAASNSEVASFTSQTLTTLIVLGSLATVFFLIKGGYAYITSTGKPDALEHAKLTIRNALIGLVLILSAGLISSLLNAAFTTPSVGTTTSQIQLKPIQAVQPTNGLTQVLLDAVSGFLLNILQSSTKPLVDGVIGFLTTTPSLIGNSVIFNFWLTIVGITDSLFALVIAAIGFHFMSASTFGFDEIEFKHLLPRIGLAFLCANTSIFLADWVLTLANTLTHALLATTGGLTNAWILNSIDPLKLQNGQNLLITLIFMLLFLIMTVVLILFYITRLITIALGAVLSPIIFLLSSLPKFADFAEISIKAYLTLIFTAFVHVVIIQLASAFLTIPGQIGTNSLISILVGIGLLFTLLKTPSFLIQLVFFNSGRGAIKKISGQVLNVITSRTQETAKLSVRTINLPDKVGTA